MRRFIDIVEAFSDLGKLSDDELLKGQRLSDPDDFIWVTPRVFFNAIKRIRANDFERMNGGRTSKGLHTLSVYSVKDYANMKCYLGSNNSSGFALNDGELVSVFSSQGSSGNALMTAAVKEGATHLDCFALRHDGIISGPLFKLYSRHGFRIDTDKNEGEPGQPYSCVNGVSDYVDPQGVVHPEDESVVIFMKRS